MFLDSFFNLLSKYHHNRIALYSKNLKFNNLIDVGCHKGEFLSSFLKIKKIKKFYCFEPQKDIYKVLKKDFKKKNNISFFNFALGNVVTKKKIYINNLSSASTMTKLDHSSFYLKFKNFLTGTNLEKQQNYYIQQKTIDKIFKNQSLKNTFLKIDVEGYEYQVLLGAKKKIKDVSYVLIENQIFNRYALRNNKISEVKNFLIKNKFKIVKNFYFPTLHYKDVLFKKKGS